MLSVLSVFTLYRRAVYGVLSVMSVLVLCRCAAQGVLSVLSVLSVFTLYKRNICFPVQREHTLTLNCAFPIPASVESGFELNNQISFVAKVALIAP